MHKLAQLDHRFVWHPFTQMRDWLKSDPIVITRGKGAIIEDVHGRKFLDANSSIWTNLHGHNHPRLNAAIRRQLGRIAHSSALGLANEPASLLAAELVRLASSPSPPPAERPAAPKPREGGAGVRGPELAKAFFSDDGSTAMEVALKLAYEFSRRTGQKKPRFLSLEGAYHGDTVGAVSLGHIDLFHKTYSGLLFQTDKVAAPYCYRCPFNRAKPERADAREYRKCNWECVGKVEQKFSKLRRSHGHGYAAMVVEPLMQGAAGMIAHPKGWLARINQIVRSHGSLLIADEVMTAFGRVRIPEGRARSPERDAAAHDPDPALFACHEEAVQPDLMALAKGITGGYLPMAATLTTQPIFDAFLGEYSEFKTFFHGHSYTANQLGSAAALANLQLLQTSASMRARRSLASSLRETSSRLWQLPNVGDMRQEGTVLAVELVKDWHTREPFDLKDRVGIRVCEAMSRQGVLTRPIGNVIVLMPPYITTREQTEKILTALQRSIVEILGSVTQKM